MLSKTCFGFYCTWMRESQETGYHLTLAFILKRIDVKQHSQIEFYTFRKLNKFMNIATHAWWKKFQAALLFLESTDGWAFSMTLVLCTLSIFPIHKKTTGYTYSIDFTFVIPHIDVWMHESIVDRNAFLLVYHQHFREQITRLTRCKRGKILDIKKTGLL